ncbi:MAG: hypothetical protein KF715_11060 [Candidatus Didemnitutus sp.]|nr:hypothetical protein [Candidatus Didemnitutus sp.]
MNSPAEPPQIPPPLPEARPRFAWVALLVGFAIGAVGWEIACRLSGRREAWDSASYWSVAYPAFGLAALVLAFIWPRSGWFTWIAIAVGQALAMFAKNPGGTLLPLGVLVMLVMSAPLLIAGRLGARLRSWQRTP